MRQMAGILRQLGQHQLRPGPRFYATGADGASEGGSLLVR